MNMQASRLKRFLNFVLDVTLWQLLTMILFVVLGLVAKIDLEKWGDVFIYICLFLSFWIYFFGCEMAFQRTFGKIITKTKVVTTQGAKPSAKSVFIRTLVRGIPVEYLSFLHARAGHHDLLSDTRVICRKPSLK